MPRLKEIYKKEIVPSLKTKFGYKNINMGPKIEKIVINMGLGLDGNDSKILKSCENDLSLLTGQKPVVTKFKKSISNFKTRKGTNSGLKVSLRKDRMYEFLDRLVTSALPRVRDFQGISSKGFDGRGNYTLGIKEQIAFPEISIDKVLKVTGMDITFVTNTDSDDEALNLLTELGLPFKKNKL